MVEEVHCDVGNLHGVAEFYDFPGLPGEFAVAEVVAELVACAEVHDGDEFVVDDEVAL